VTAFAVQPAFAASKAEIARSLSKHYSSVPTMTGEFVQFGPSGEQTGGKFYIQRPGKIRFSYEAPSNLQVVSNGKTVAVNNPKLKTWNFFPLRKTPLKLLLDDKIDLKSKQIKSIKTDPDVTTIVMGDKNIFGKSQITLLFDPKNFELRQWTIKDAQGKETSVMLFNVEKNVKLSRKLFRVNKNERRKKVGQKNDK